MAKKMSKKRKQPAGQELSDDQLEAVAGGVILGDVAATPVLEDGTAEEKKKGTAGNLLLQACATGQHIKSGVITVRGG